MIDFDTLVLGPCMDAFAEPVLYRPATGAPIPLRGVFEKSLREIKPDREGLAILTQHPVLGLRVSEMIAAGVPPDRLPCQDELIDVRGYTWSIKNAEPPDSEGHMKLELMRTGDFGTGGNG